jgi:hypothetical protein
VSGRLVEKVKRAGFEIMLTTSFMSLLLPLLLASRLKQGYSQDNYDVTTELRINPLLNRLLERV